MAARRVAVVGAGLAGLSAAVELRQRGCVVDIYERGRLLGGKATSYEVDGVEVDNGQHVFLGCCTEFIDFVTGIGMADKIHLQDRFATVMLKRGERPYRLQASGLPAPLHLAPALLRDPYLGWPARLQIAWAIARAGRTPPPDETFAAWLDRHHQGDQARRSFWDPFLIPALNAPAAEVAAVDACFVISTAFGRDPRAACFGFVEVPLARIAEAAADRAGTLHRRTAVSGLVMDGGKVIGIKLSDGSEERFDAVVLAVPPKALARILGEPDRFGLSGLDAFATAPIVDVHLWYDQRNFGFDFAALLDSPVQWVFQKASGYLCCSLSAAGSLVTRPEPELIELCHEELRAMLPELASARPVRAAATRDPDATFVPAPGLQRPGPATSSPNLAIAGAWTATGWPATMESAVRSGRAAARLIVAGGPTHVA